MNSIHKKIKPTPNKIVIFDIMNYGVNVDLVRGWILSKCKKISTDINNIGNDIYLGIIKRNMSIVKTNGYASSYDSCVTSYWRGAGTAYGYHYRNGDGSSGISSLGYGFGIGDDDRSSGSGGAYGSYSFSNMFNGFGFGNAYGHNYSYDPRDSFDISISKSISGKARSRLMRENRFFSNTVSYDNSVIYPNYLAQ